MGKKTISFKNILDTEYTMKMREWRNQDFVTKNMINQETITVEQHEKYLELLRAKSDTRKVFVCLENEKPFAILNFTIFREDNYIEPATYLINKSFLGKGYGLVVNIAKMSYIFKVLPCGEMRTKVLTTNNVNYKLQLKMGAKLRNIVSYTDEKGTDRELYSLYATKEMWEAKKPVLFEEIKQKFIGIEIEDIPE